MTAFRIHFSLLDYFLKTGEELGCRRGRKQKRGAPKGEPGTWRDVNNSQVACTRQLTLPFSSAVPSEPRPHPVPSLEQVQLWAHHGTGEMGLPRAPLAENV